MSALVIPQGTAISSTRLRALADMPAQQALERAGYALLALLVFVGCFVASKPAPYEGVAVLALIVWAVRGLRLHRSVVLFAGLLFAWRLGVVAALLPYTDDPDSVGWTLQSIYLVFVALFFAVVMTEDTERRMELALKAYVASCVVASLAGIVGYFVESGLLFATYGRASGLFPDPNVFGSYLTLSAIYLAHKLFTGGTRRPVLAALCLGLILIGVFLSFSRGSWAATVAGIALTAALTFRTSPGRIRRRIIILAVASVGVSVVGLAGLLSVSSVGERFTDRAQVTHDYDEGENGRFGNQLRSIPMLVENPGGFGPFRFHRTFGIDPHNSYIGGFANGGWIGGIGFISLVLVTIFVGARLCVRPSPYRRFAFVVCPALLMFFLQAFQIDIDPWRHVYMLMGMVWGLEAARMRWEVPAGRAAARPSGTDRPKIAQAA